MYAQLGNIRFEGLKGFLSIARTRAARYAEMDRLDGKARLQRTGDELETLSFDLRLHQGFSNLTADLATLNRYQADGEVLPLIDGAGELLGNFVLRRMEEKPEIQDTQGRAISVLLKVELAEFVGEIDQPAEGFASSADRVVPVRLVRIATTVTASTVQSVSDTELNAAAAAADIERAAISPSERSSLFARAASRVKQVQAKAQESIEKIQDFNSVAQSAPNLLTAVQTVKDNADLFAAAILSGDLTNALSTGRNLNDSLSLTQAARFPLTLKLILKQ